MPLYLISTPIGNLGDISHRALDTLSESDLVLAEDTRKSGLLLAHFDLKKPLLSLHEHNEESRIAQVLELLAKDQKISLISDAGTPTISDPGFKLVRATVAEKVEVIPIPGPNAALAALSASGLPTDHFLFVGYLPKTEGKAEKILLSLKEMIQKLPMSLIFYEGPHRLEKTLERLQRFFPGANIAVAREITKLHEEFIRGSIEEVREKFHDRVPKGEFTLVLRQ